MFISYTLVNKVDSPQSPRSHLIVLKKLMFFFKD